MVDHNEAFLGVARQLAAMSHTPALQAAKFELAEIVTYEEPAAKYDVVIASYAMTELDNVRLAAANLFKSAACMFVVIEPGRPRDYQRLLEARSHLVDTGRVIGPCPHSNTCPLPSGDWCHFSTRLPRSRDHMRAKNAVVPFEDEKFFYMAICPKGSSLDRGPFDRVLAPPIHTKHNLTLKLCTPTGLESRTTQSRDKAAFKRFKKVEWGDSVEDPSS